MIRKFFQHGLISITIATLLFFGCNDTAIQPNRNGGLSADALGSSVVIADDLELLKDSGVATDTVYGVFSIGWNQFIAPNQQTAQTSGHAFAIATAEQQAVPGDRLRRASGLDLGDVTVKYSGNSVALNKRETFIGGFVYALFQKHRDTSAVALDYGPGATYDFVVSGSADFNPLTVSLIAPDALLDITSNASGDTIRATEDFALTWSGGFADREIVIKITPHFGHRGGFQPGGKGPKPGQRGRFGNGNGPENGDVSSGDFSGARPGDRPMPHQRPGAIFVKLDNNPGEYTITAEQLQELLSEFDGHGFAVHVFQLSVQPFEHDGKPYQAVMRNGDRVTLTIQ